MGRNGWVGWLWLVWTLPSERSGPETGHLTCHATVPGLYIPVARLQPASMPLQHLYKKNSRDHLVQHSSNGDTVNHSPTSPPLRHSEWSYAPSVHARAVLKSPFLNPWPKWNSSPILSKWAQQQVHIALKMPSAVLQVIVLHLMSCFRPYANPHSPPPIHKCR